jgi:2-dehydro-3-deoxygalactonokinase
MHEFFFSCDWGTSFLRLRLVDAVTGAVLHELVSAQGIKSVYEAWLQTGQPPEQRIAFYLAVLSRHIEQLQQEHAFVPKALPVIISGMASANIGITELAYKPLPLAIDGHNLAWIQLEKTAACLHDIIIISGACTATDVMRGEETQLIGCAALSHLATDLFILPGTHSKHVYVMDGVVRDFKTFMTGELFALLSQYSILSSSVAAVDAPADTLAFEQGVKAGVEEHLLHTLFRVRTNTLFNRLSKQANYHYLSGLLIGAELQGLKGENVNAITLVGEPALANRYSQAITMAGIHCSLQVIDAATATVQGQLVIYRRWLGN